jgi:hypothetical protein
MRHEVPKACGGAWNAGAAWRPSCFQIHPPCEPIASSPRTAWSSLAPKPRLCSRRSRDIQSTPCPLAHSCFALMEPESSPSAKRGSTRVVGGPWRRRNTKSAALRCRAVRTRVTARPTRVDVSKTHPRSRSARATPSGTRARREGPEARRGCPGAGRPAQGCDRTRSSPHAPPSAPPSRARCSAAGKAPLARAARR